MMSDETEVADDRAMVAEIDHFRTILGVRFFTGSPEDAVRLGLNGGLVVVPSAPVLVGLECDPVHRESLLEADFAITDSGLMVLLWRLLRREKIVRVSGLEYLKLLLNEPSIREPGAAVWIMPTAAARDRNLAWLRTQGWAATIDDCYLTPLYPKGALDDTALIAWLEKKRPRHVIVALGGGTQERLGAYIKRRMDYAVGIHCIGAAIGFLSGDQVNIPPWADYLFLGWFFRCVSAPTKFVPRYWKAKRLAVLMWRYGENLPPLKRKAEKLKG